MGEKTSAESIASVGVAAVGSVQLYRLFQRLRHRAIHPAMDDPGKDLVRWMRLAAVGFVVVVAIAAAGLFAWLGPVAIIFAVMISLIAIVAWLATAVSLWINAESRRRAVRYVICEDDYADAPRQIKSTMRRICRSAKSVRSSQAHQRDMFGDLSLDEAVYGAAERAILSSELSAAIRDLRPDAQSSDQALLDDANQQIRAIKDELASVEAALKRGAKSAEKLSQRVTEPERQQAAERTRQDAACAAKERRLQARARLEEASVHASAVDRLETDTVSDRIDAVAEGYDEARKVSDQVSGAPSMPVGPQPDTDGSNAGSTRDALAKAAKRTAGAAKWSAAAAKTGAERFKK